MHAYDTPNVVYYQSIVIAFFQCIGITQTYICTNKTTNKTVKNIRSKKYDIEYWLFVEYAINVNVNVECSIASIDRCIGTTHTSA